MKGVWLWMLERYPPGIIVVHALAYLTSIAVAQALLSDSISFLYVRDGLGIVVFFLFPLILRIMDEHKDYETDCRLHPQRVLQRGDTSLFILRRVAWGAVIVQGAFCVYVDQGLGVVTLLWLATMLYAVLMAKEFFCGEWLQKRMMLYAISHQLITPLSVLWFCSMATTPALPPNKIWGYALLALLSTLAYELTRKIRPPEEEREGLDSYTKSLGSWQAPLLAMLIFIGIGLGTPYWLNHIGIPVETMTIMLGFNALWLILCLFFCLSFGRSPLRAWAKGMEAMSAVMTLWMYGWVLYALCQTKEVLWMF